MYLELKVLSGIYSGSDDIRSELDGFSLVDLPLVNDSWGEVENAKWESIQDRLNFNGMINGLVPNTLECLTKIKSIQTMVTSFNKRAENLSFGKVGKLTGKYYSGDYSNSDMHFSDFEFIIKNKATQYHPTMDRVNRVKAEKEFESIYAKLLFMSMYKTHHMFTNNSWENKLRTYNNENVDRFQNMNTTSGNDNLSDYFNEYMANELTQTALSLFSSPKNTLTNITDQVAKHEIYGVFEKIKLGIQDDIGKIISKIQKGTSAIINPLKVKFAVYEKHNNEKKYVINHIDDVYAQNNAWIIGHLNMRLNEFHITSLDITPTDNNYIEHTFHRPEKKVGLTVDEYNYPMSRSVMFPPAIKVKIKLKNNRKFTLNEWIKYYSMLTR